MNESSTANGRAPCLLALLCSTFAGTLAYAQARGVAQAEKPLYVEKTRGLGQCEMFLHKGQPGRFEALVYNTTGLNDCPPSKFDPIDAKQVAQKIGVDVAWKDTRRFWMMDSLTISLVGEPRDFDGLPFNCVAKMTMPPGFTPGKGPAGFAYQADADSPQHHVRVPEGQAGLPVAVAGWTQLGHADVHDAHRPQPDRGRSPDTGPEAEVADGVAVQGETLDRDLLIRTTGLASIVPENLENMYQGCNDGVCSFDPWK